MAVIQYHIEALGSGRTYDLLTYYNHIITIYQRLTNGVKLHLETFIDQGGGGKQFHEITTL